MNEKVVGQIAEVAKEIVKPVYDDIRPVVKPTAGLLSLPVRAVKASLLNFEKWIVTREQNLEDFINVHVPKQLQGVPEDKIESPNAYLAVPILQAASYCDSDELRDMYAKLLAKAMVSETKQKVHPSFVQIVNQICPDEAKILHFINDNVNPQIICKLSQVKGDLESIDKDDNRTVNISFKQVDNISFLGFDACCNFAEEIGVYIDNLCRLKLVEKQFPEDGPRATFINNTTKCEWDFQEIVFENDMNENPIKRKLYEEIVLDNFPDALLPTFYNPMVVKSHLVEASPNDSSDIVRNFYRLSISSFGRSFINAVAQPITDLQNNKKEESFSVNRDMIIAVNVGDAQLFFDFAKEVPDNVIVVEHRSFIGIAELQEFIITVTPHFLTALTAYLVARSQSSKGELRMKKGDIEVEIKSSDITPDTVLSLLEKLEQ